MLVREVAVTYTGDSARHDGRRPVRGPEAVAGILGELVGQLTVERFYVLHLDGRHRPVGFHMASQGTLTASLVHPREVFRAAILQGAAAIILAHNHPSGDVRPSGEDRAITQRLKKAGELLGVPVLDHVILAGLGGGTFYSMREGGDLDG